MLRKTQPPTNIVNFPVKNQKIFVFLCHFLLSNTYI